MRRALRLHLDRGAGPWVEAGQSLRIGRSSSNDLRLDRSGISRQHARILSRGGHFYLEDLGSSNGTALNGKLVRSKVRLRDGDRVRLGDTDLAVELLGGGAAPARPELRWLPLAAAAMIPMLLFAGVRLFSSGTAQAKSAAEEGEGAVELSTLVGDEILEPRAEGGLVIAFDFPPGAGEEGESRVTLRFDAAYVEERGVELRLNGEGLGFAPPAPEGWKEGLELILPPRALHRGGRNLLAFITPYGGSDAWQLRRPELLVEPIPRCAPAVCVEEAERLHAIGLRKYEARALIPSNLYEAWVAFREAELFLAPLGERIRLADRLGPIGDQAKADLDRRCSQLRFTVLRSVALGDEQEARRAAEAILQSFPGDRHRCRAIGAYLLELLDA